MNLVSRFSRGQASRFFITFFCISVFGGVFMSQQGKAALIEKTLVYQNSANEKFEGFVVYDEKATGLLPGILVVHDWLGLSEKTKEKARDLARLGYLAFALDIYGVGVRPKNPGEAGKQAGIFKGDRSLYRKRLNLGLDALRKQSKLDKTQLAAVGYCFGGTGVIELARSGVKINAIVSFHGGLDSPDPSLGKNIKAKVLVLHGADDPFEKEVDLAAFEKEMRDAQVDWQLVKYGNAVHSFTDKSAGDDASKGAAYNERADKRSWKAMQSFLDEAFGR